MPGTEDGPLLVPMSPPCRPGSMAARYEALEPVYQLYRLSCRCRRMRQQLEDVNVEAARLAVEDLAKTFPLPVGSETQPTGYDGKKHRQAVEALASQREPLLKGLADGSATSSFRLPYRQYQRVYNVGFRVILEDTAAPALTTAAK